MAWTISLPTPVSASQCGLTAPASQQQKVNHVQFRVLSPECPTRMSKPRISSALSHAAQLKPEIRLAQAVSEFEAALSSDQKATFRAYQSQSLSSLPNAGDVMRLTAAIDRSASRIGGGGRCYGPRLTNILRAVQQFAALGDILVGGSQNVIACGVWSLIRLTLLVDSFGIFGNSFANLDS
jgi:hypothetical protein